MAFRWFVGLDLGAKVWDDSTFARNRCERFEGTDIFEKLFDDTIKRAMGEGWVSAHWSVDGTLVRADASHKSLTALEPKQSPEEYREVISGKKKVERTKKHDDDGTPKNPTVRWEGEKRSNATHGSKTDPDSRLAFKGKDGAHLSYQVNGVMENRNRLLMGIGVEIFTGSTGEREGALELINRARRRFRLKPKSRSYQQSQRSRKRIEELWGEGKEYHGLRRFRRRGLEHVRQEAHLIGWLLNLKRLSTLYATT